jgi:hypothetical protein
MKKIFAFVAISFFLSSCYDNHSEVIPGQDFIPDEILAEIRENGQPIFEGLNPPDVTGRYIIDPYVLVASNFEDSSEPGREFARLTTRFSEFSPDNLTLKVDLDQGGNEGEGFGSFISGQGNNFTIYVRIERERDEFTTLETRVYSGTLEDRGIRNLYVSLFMIDDRGDPEGNLIENGEGRLFRDEDGFSERVD